MDRRTLANATSATLSVLLSALSFGAESAPLVSGTWNVPPSFLKDPTLSVPKKSETVTDPSATAGPKPTRHKGPQGEVDAKEVLLTKGISFEDSSAKASYNQKTQTLSLTNTQLQLDRLDALVKDSKREAIQKAIRDLSSEERVRLSENLQQWNELTNDQKQALRQRYSLIRKQASEEAATLAKDLPESQREAFHKRYMEERRQVEANLRAEFEQRRKAAMGDLMDRLRQEVGATPQAPAAIDKPAPASNVP